MSSNWIYGYFTFSGGGGAARCDLADCTIIGNSADQGQGGGVYYSTARFCTLAFNSTAGAGGGAGDSTLNNCIISSNAAFSGSGGGAYSGQLSGCALTGNRAVQGGGAAMSTLRNCTVTGNSAVGLHATGGGVWSSTLANTIVYFNKAESGPNYANSGFSFSCTTPLPNEGIGNIDRDPRLASPTHLSADSPCRSAGQPLGGPTATDIDGEQWAVPPAIGCDEYHPDALAGSLKVDLAVAFTNLAVGVPTHFWGLVQGKVAASAWDFGDATIVSNQPYATHSWDAPGTYSIVLRAFNSTFPDGVAATGTVHIAGQALRYVSPVSANPKPPFMTWATAARTIQDAVEVAAAQDLILVTNGVYNIGGRAVFGQMTNRISLDKPITVRSVNGPEVTVIEGHEVSLMGEGAVRCAYLVEGAVMSGFTLTKGSSRDWRGDLFNEQNGGGAWCQGPGATITNCILVSNHARNQGGGAYQGTLINCLLTQNSALGGGGGAAYAALNGCTLATNTTFWEDVTQAPGGGAAFSALNDCTLVGNFALQGGGAWRSALQRCTVVGNGTWREGGGVLGGTLDRCILRGNVGGTGAGAYEATLNNCLLTGNRAGGAGGGAAFSILTNCTVTLNQVCAACEPGDAGGVLDSTLMNCIVYSNSGPKSPNFSGGLLNFTCVDPLPSQGIGNIATNPLFVAPGAGNFRLQTNSPCINKGLIESAVDNLDLDGQPRIIGTSVDMGAFEFQSGLDPRFLGWLEQYGFARDGSVSDTDADRDGRSNWQEWYAGTNPTNALSVLRLVAWTRTATNMTMQWNSVSGRHYAVEAATNLSSPLIFHPVATNIVSGDATTAFTDNSVPVGGRILYRVRLDDEP